MIDIIQTLYYIDVKSQLKIEIQWYIRRRRICVYEAEHETWQFTKSTLRFTPYSDVRVRVSLLTR